MLKQTIWITNGGPHPEFKVQPQHSGWEILGFLNSALSPQESHIWVGVLPFKWSSIKHVLNCLYFQQGLKRHCSKKLPSWHPLFVYLVRRVCPWQSWTVSGMRPWSTAHLGLVSHVSCGVWIYDLLYIQRNTGNGCDGGAVRAWSLYSQK